MQTKIKGFRLSPQQKRLWFCQQDSPTYLTQCAIRLEGMLKPEVLKTALQHIVNRHEILRTRFHHLTGVKTPVMVVADRSSLVWQEIDLSDWDSQKQSAKIKALFHDVRYQEFDWDQSSLFRVSLLKLSQTVHYLHIYLPTICADTWTIKTLIYELSQTYLAYLHGEELDDEVVQFLQFSEWQHQLLEDEEATSAKEYWRQQTLSSSAPLRLPFERKGLKQSGFEPDCLEFAIASNVTTHLEALARQSNTSVAVVLHACWQTLLWRLTGASEMIIGTACDRRNYEELHGVLGLLATWIPIKSHLTPDLPIQKVIKLVQNAISNTEEWQDYFVPEPLDNDNPLAFPIGFEFEELPEKCMAAGVSFSLEKQYSCIEPFKIKLTCTQHPDSLRAELHYDRNYVSAEAVARLAGQFQTLLSSATENPDTAISRLEILTPRDRQQLLVEFNQTQIDDPLDPCIHQRFEEQVQKTPNTIAVVFEDQQLTYAQLNQKANQLAHTLQQRGVKPEGVVGLWVERSLDMIVGLLGILKAGGAYLPLDPALPIEALTFRLQDAQVPILLTQQSLVETCPTLAAQVICLDTDWDTMAQQSDANPSNEVTRENLVYVIYTSGSTGKPKGVAIENRQLLNYLNGIINQLDLSRGASFATVSTFAADLGNTAIFSALCTGGCLHIISQEGATNPEALADYCNHHPIDCLKIVPSHLKALLSSSHPEKILPKKGLILGGEALSWTLVENLQQYAPSCQIINHYGPTETTIGVLTYSIEDESIPERSQTVPIGRPLANTQVYILDEHLQPVPIGVAGELYIGGDNLARGYLNQPELTNERFIPNPFSHESESRLYKTGDLARYLPDGTIEFLGRIDNQIKIRGFRIEPGEIESVLRQNPEVQDVAVLVREDEPGGTRLVAYVIPRQGKTFNTSELRHFLKEKLPDYMMPSAFVLLKNLPLTANGKVDFQALRSLEITRPDLEDAFVAPRTPVEESLARIWAELLGLEQVGVHDNFFDLGGHSLLVTQVVSRLRDTFAVELPLSNFFDAPTVADLAVIITQRLAEQTDSELLAKTFAELEQLSEEEVQALLAAEKEFISQEGSRK